MKLTYILIFLLIPLQYLHSQQPEFEWAKSAGGGAEDKGNSMAIDKWGNVYSTGSFRGTVDFDPGPGVFDLTATAGKKNIFILKLDALGNFIWAKCFTGGDGVGNAIKTDDKGNVYSAGNFFETVDFDPGGGNYFLTGISAAFLSKLDPAGNFVWVRGLGGENATGGFANVSSIAMDADANVYYSGAFVNTLDFDPGTGIFTLPGTGAADFQVFILKFNSNGEFVWVKHLAGIGSTNSGSSLSVGKTIVLDNEGNIFVGGYFTKTVDFDPGPSVYNLDVPFQSSNGFILKLNSSGDFVWVRRFGKSTGTENSYLAYSAAVTSLSVDNEGNIYTTGSFSDTIDFDPGPGVHNFSTGRYLISNYYNYWVNGFVASLDKDGNFIWARQLGDGSNSALTNGVVTTDREGNLYLMGSFWGVVDFGQGGGGNSNEGSGNLCIVKYQSSGSLLWLETFGQSQNGYNYTVFVDDYLNVYTAGDFTGTVDFNPGTANNDLTSNGDYDLFVQKLRQCFDSTSSLLKASACSTYILNDQPYSVSGIYAQTILNWKNCDSIITLQLTIEGGNNKVITAAACKRYYWNAKTYITSGNYVDTLMSSNGCDSIVTLQLSIIPAPVFIIEKSICQGENYDGHTISGIYNDTLATADGCDSIVRLVLSVTPPFSSTVTKTICRGDVFEGYTIEGLYTDTFVSVIGCDSIRTLNLTVKDICIPLGIPNAFTPNKDGRNDFFRPLIGEVVVQYQMDIYNRYGQKIFETNDHLLGWDGSYEGKQQSAGTYIYHVYLKTISGKVFDKKGTVVIIR